MRQIDLNWIVQDKLQEDDCPDQPESIRLVFTVNPWGSDNKFKLELDLLMDLSDSQFNTCIGQILIQNKIALAEENYQRLYRRYKSMCVLKQAGKQFENLNANFVSVKKNFDKFSNAMGDIKLTGDEFFDLFSR